MALRTVRAREMDACCIGERLERGRKRLHPLPMPVAQLPDGAMVQAGRGEFSDPAGQGAAMVDGWLSAKQSGAIDNAMLLDAAVDAARVECRISAGAASKRV